MARLLDKCLISACAALAFSVVSAAAVQDDFESTDAGATPDGWSGNGAVATETVTYSKAVGLPISSSEHTKTLAVSGQAVRTYTTESETTYKSAKVDMMVKVMAADEVPDAPDTTDDIQVAIATGPVEDGATVAPIYIYKGTTANDETTYAWENTGKSYETNSWVRLMMVMNYDNSTCEVTIDGNPIATVNFVGTPKATAQVSNITVEGLTSLDDVVMEALTESATDVKPYPDTATSGTAKVGDGDDAVPVKLNWLFKNGLDIDSENNIMGTTCDDGSNMTYADKYDAGLDIKDEQKFEVSSMTVTEANKVGFTVPGAADSYTVAYSCDGGTYTDAGSDALSKVTTDGNTTVTVDLSKITTSSKVIKFQLKAKALDPNASAQ